MRIVFPSIVSLCRLLWPLSLLFFALLMRFRRKILVSPISADSMHLRRLIRWIQRRVDVEYSSRRICCIALRRVLLGLNMRETLYDLIMSWIRKSGLALFSMLLSHSHYYDQP